MNNFKSNRKPSFRDSNRGFGSRDKGRKAMHDATCEKCGNDCKVPFKPSGDKPVYCSQCFEDQGNISQGFRKSRDNKGFKSRDNRRDSDYSDKKLFSATCDSCQRECQVPFRPTTGKPIYCDNCFKKGSNKAQSYSESPRPRNNSKDDLAQINSKLDQILKILSKDSQE